MTVNELIAALQDVKETCGDLPVVFDRGDDYGGSDWHEFSDITRDSVSNYVSNLGYVRKTVVKLI